MIHILTQASTLTSPVLLLSWLTPRFTSPSVICSRVGILVKSQACKTKGLVFEPQSGHFLVSFYCFYCMPLFEGKAQLPEPYMILLYVPWWHRVFNLVPMLEVLKLSTHKFLNGQTHSAKNGHNCSLLVYLKANYRPQRLDVYAEIYPWAASEAYHDISC